MNFKLHYTRLVAIALISLVALLAGGCKTKRLAYHLSATDSAVVFEPVKDVYASMRITALVVTKQGSLLAFCEGRMKSAADWGDMNLLMRRSTDGGKTWSAQVILAGHKDGNPVSNPTPVVDRDGTIHLWYQRNYNTAYYIRSADDGLHWTEAADMTSVFEGFKRTYNWTVLAPGPGHAIEMASGRLLVPVWLAESEKLLPHRSHSPTCVATIYSDDKGLTWKCGTIAAINSPEIKNPNETMAVQLNDGRVMLNIRNGGDVHQRAVSFSADGISGWSAPEFNPQLFDPICMASIVNIPDKRKGGESTLLFVNPDSHDLIKPKFPRQNLTAKISFDSGKTWPSAQLIHKGYTGYSDTAVGPDGTIYCLYESNSSPNFNYSIVLKRFNLDGFRKKLKISKELKLLKNAKNR
jgi:sialidase-1